MGSRCRGYVDNYFQPLAIVKDVLPAEKAHNRLLSYRTRSPLPAGTMVTVSEPPAAFHPAATSSRKLLRGEVFSRNAARRGQRRKKRPCRREMLQIQGRSRGGRAASAEILADIDGGTEGAPCRALMNRSWVASGMRRLQKTTALIRPRINGPSATTYSRPGM